MWGRRPVSSGGMENPDGTAWADRIREEGEWRPAPPVTDTRHEDEQSAPRAANMGTSKSVEALRDYYQSLPLATIPERDSIYSTSTNRLSTAPTASSVYTGDSPELGGGFDHFQEPLPAFSRSDTTSKPTPQHLEQKPASTRSRIPMLRKALPIKEKPKEQQNFSERAARRGMGALSIETAPRGSQKSTGGIVNQDFVKSAPVNSVKPDEWPHRTDGWRSATSTSRADYESQNPALLANTREESSGSITPQGLTAAGGPGPLDLPDAYAFQFVADSADDDPVKPTDPLKAGNNSPVYSRDRSVQSVVQNFRTPSSPSPDVSPSSTSSIPGSPTTFVSAEAQYQMPGARSMNESLKRNYGQVTSNSNFSVEATPNSQMSPDSVVRNPASRFSWTTYTTEDTRRSTDSRTVISEEEEPFVTPTRAEPMDGSHFSWTPGSVIRSPSPESSYGPEPSPPRHIMLRKRPISSASSVKRKPTPSQAAAASNAKISKELPLSPPELASVDLVTALQAQIDDMQHRRWNLEKLIKNMSRVAFQNPMIQDLSARRAEARKLEGFKTQVAEIQRAEHELGIRLSRAWKRRDQEAPTTLWIRRVTT